MTEPRRIGLDYTPAHEQTGGIGRYARELTAALAAIDGDYRYRLFVAGATSAGLPKAPSPRFAWRTVRISPRWLARIWHRARLPIPIELATGPLDLFHATDFALPPTLPGTRTLLTVHDLSFARAPEAASPPLKAYLDAVVPRSVRRADHILADSAATKADLSALYGTRPTKISVLYSGVDQRFRPVEDPAALASALARHGLAGKPYILSVGTLQPRKNYGRVIEAVARARAAGFDLHYAIAGGSGWLQDEIWRAIKGSGMEDFTHILGFVADDELPALYSGARALILASLYEGFGLPILEAMACGAPVIASDVSSLPEVAGEAGILVDPKDSAAISAAIMRLERDDGLRTRLVENGFQRAKQFSWERAARQLKRVYDRILSGKAPGG